MLVVELNGKKCRHQRYCIRALLALENVQGHFEAILCTYSF